MTLMTTTHTQATSIDLISDMFQTYLSEQAVLIPSIIDRSNEARNGVKSIDYNRRSGFTAEEKTESGDYTAQVLTYTADTLSLNKQRGVYIELTDQSKTQGAQRVEMDLMEGSFDALKDKLETEIFTALKDVSTSTPDHAISFQTAGVLSVSDVSTAKKLLTKQNVPLTDRFLAINPEQEEQLIRLDQFISAEKYGSNTVLMTGEVGRLLGFRVLVSNNVTEDEAVAYHRSHAVFARQLALTWEKTRNLKAAKTEYLMQTLYGLETLDDGVRGVYYS